MTDSARFDMSISAHDVAAELRRRFKHDPGVVKIHKLLYYAQGWHLAWTGERLYSEHIEAWTNGPVVADLWRDEKYDHPKPAPQELAGPQLATIDYVVARYGQCTARELIRRTHEEAPWRDASEADANGWGLQNPEISPTELRRFFEIDDEYLADAAEAERLSKVRGDPFDPLEVTAELEAAVERAIRGERVRHSRPS